MCKQYLHFICLICCFIACDQPQEQEQPTKDPIIVDSLPHLSIEQETEAPKQWKSSVDSAIVFSMPYEITWPMEGFAEISAAEFDSLAVVQQVPPDMDSSRVDFSDSTLTILNFAPPEVDANLKHSSQAQLSADGQVGLFKSDATNLVPGDTNGVEDIFVRDLWSGTTERVSVLHPIAHKISFKNSCTQSE